MACRSNESVNERNLGPDLGNSLPWQLFSDAHEIYLPQKVCVCTYTGRAWEIVQRLRGQHDGHERLKVLGVNILIIWKPNSSLDYN